MILLDPDLDLDKPPRPRASKSTPAQNPSPLPSVRALTHFLRQAQAAVRLRGQVSVLLTGDAAIRKLNRRFRGKKQATDVLSFPAEAAGSESIAGDIAISLPTAQRQAAAQGHSLATEIKVLMLHGLLHLAGCDHETDTGEMARREQKLRARLGLPLGLIERVAAPALAPEKKRKEEAQTRRATADPSTRSLRELAQDDKRLKEADDDNGLGETHFVKRLGKVHDDTRSVKTRPPRSRNP